MTHHFSLRSQNSEYSRIFKVTGANQNVQNIVSTDLVNTKTVYLLCLIAIYQTWRGTLHFLLVCCFFIYLFICNYHMIYYWAKKMPVIIIKVATEIIICCIQNLPIRKSPSELYIHLRRNLATVHYYIVLTIHAKDLQLNTKQFYAQSLTL